MFLKITPSTNANDDDDDDDITTTTPWSRVLLKMLIITQLVKKLLFLELEGSLPCSQEPSTGPYLESDASSPHLPILFP